MKWFTAFLWTLLLCFGIISYSFATTIDPIAQPKSISFEGGISQISSEWSIGNWYNSDNLASLVADWSDWNWSDWNWSDWNWWNEQIDTNDNSNVSHSPIPPAVWLLSSGLVGIIALRRKFKN